MELTEAKNYKKFLVQARSTGRISGMKTAFFMGFLMLCIYSTYAYAFTIGPIWVQRGFYNAAYGRNYLPGDIIGVFFGLIFGFFGLAGIGPNFTLVAQGKASGKLAFDVIDRDPSIDADSQEGEKINLEGKIEFKDVDFFYPTRPDTQVLKKLSLTFELGKTTAIVGPSGSGKSTIVQLIERFYDPNAGEVLIDGHNIKDLNLRSYRRQVGYVS
jgi:ATP-binding cassette subfamily B (MDR/TAP) protein 1